MARSIVDLVDVRPVEQRAQIDERQRADVSTAMPSAMVSPPAVRLAGALAHRRIGRRSRRR